MKIIILLLVGLMMGCSDNQSLLEKVTAIALEGMKKSYHRGYREGLENSPSNDPLDIFGFGEEFDVKAENNLTTFHLVCREWKGKGLKGTDSICIALGTNKTTTIEMNNCWKECSDDCGEQNLDMSACESMCIVRCNFHEN